MLSARGFYRKDFFRCPVCRALQKANEIFLHLQHCWTGVARLSAAGLRAGWGPPRPGRAGVLREGWGLPRQARAGVFYNARPPARGSNMPQPPPAKSSAKSDPPPVRARPTWSRQVLRISGWLLGLTAAAVAGLALRIAVALSAAYPNLPDISELADYRPKLPLRVYSAEGALLGEFGEERRNLTPIAEIPKVMKDAVLAVEDAR